MSLTNNQQRVLDELRKIGRESVDRYKESCPYLYQEDCKKVRAGDEYCAFGLGGLTYQVGHRLGLSAGSVLSIFKSLEKKRLVLQETSYPEYQRPRYWWPAGLAADLAGEMDCAEARP